MGYIKNFNGLFVCLLEILITFAPSNSTRIVRWCNGSTADFGSACLGSNPGRTTTGKLPA